MAGTLGLAAFFSVGGGLRTVAAGVFFTTGDGAGLATGLAVSGWGLGRGAADWGGCVAGGLAVDPGVDTVESGLLIGRVTAAVVTVRLSGPGLK